MESFEITFFYKNNVYDNKTFQIVNNHVKKYNFFGKKVDTETFNDEDKDFVQIRVSIFDLVLTEENCNDIFCQLSIFVSEIFEKIPIITFATGVYELTYYLIRNKKYLYEFNSEFLKTFPIVFLRSINNQNYGKKLFEDKNVTCVFNKKAQVLYE